MKGIRFGAYHSYDTFSLILSEKTIGTPTPKTELIEIPGGDGVLDLTEFFGEVKYNNRPLSFVFSTMVPQSEFMTLFSNVQNALHGQKMEIVLDEDPEWVYTGRISVSEWKAERTIGKLTIDCDCEPYKYRITSKPVYLCGRNLINLDAGTATVEDAWTKTETGYTYSRGAETAGSFVYWRVPVKKGQSYVFSADYTLTTRLLYVYRERLYGDLIAKVQSGQPAVFVAEENGIYVFGIYATSAANDAVFANIMLQEGETVGEYEPYDAAEIEVVETFSNTRKTAVPTAYMAGNIIIATASNYVTLTEGINILPEFPFYKGETELTYNGNGVVVMEWKEGGL